MSKKELALVESGILPDKEIMDMALAEIKSLGDDGIPYGRAKITSTESTRFTVREVGDGETDVSDPKEITGIIIATQNRNSYWANPMGQGETKTPDCFSTDSITGVDKEGEVHNCATCPMNQFGSAANGGGGKACKNQVYIFILRKDELFPLLFIIPPTSLRAFKNYRLKLINMRVPLHGVLSTMTLTKVQPTDGGVPYPVLTFGEPKKLPDSEAERLKDYITAFKGFAETIETVNDEAPVEPVAASAPATNGFTEVEDEDVPFL